MPIGMPTEAEVAALMAQLSAPPATPTATPTTPPAAADPAAPPPMAMPNVTVVNATGPLGIGAWSDTQTADAISTLRGFGLDAKDAAYLTSGKDLVVSASVRERAVAERAKVMADPEWVARYLAGGIVERELMSAIVVRMASEVRE
jgi:hypothetical protein